VLCLASLRKEPDEFQWFDEPPPELVQKARDDLVELKAIDIKPFKAKDLGKLSVETGCPINLTKVVDEGRRLKGVEFGVAVAAALHFVHISNASCELNVGAESTDNFSSSRSSVNVDALCVRAILTWCRLPQSQKASFKTSNLKHYFERACNWFNHTLEAFYRKMPDWRKDSCQAGDIVGFDDDDVFRCITAGYFMHAIYELSDDEVMKSYPYAHYASTRSGEILVAASNKSQVVPAHKERKWALYVSAHSFDGQCIITAPPVPIKLEWIKNHS